MQSSQKLANQMASSINNKNASVIAELGPGTGIVTKEILSKVPRECNFFSIEANANIANFLKKQIPEAKIFNDCASKIGDYTEEKCDYIISSLPWTVFDADLQHKILQSIKNNLTPDGEFITYTYIIGNLLPGGKQFKQALNSYFSQINKSQIIWQNFPPAFVYTCKL